MLILWLLILIVSLFVLIKASDYFTDSAERIGIFFGMPAFIVGVTIVAVGTSLPELISSIIAVLRNSSEMVVGNVLGSNIANIFFVLGIAAVVARKKIKIGYELIHVDLPILVGSAFLLAATIWDGKFTLFEALLCLAALVVYFAYATHIGKKHPGAGITKELKSKMREIKGRMENGVRRLDPKVWLTFVISAVLIFIGAKYTVEAVINLSELLNIGKAVIAATAVGLGTSLPELSVCISAVRKGKTEMAVGNVLGSNIFNALGVMGISALFGVLVIPTNMLMFALPIMLLGTILYFFITQDREITKWEGWLLLIFYVFFIGKMFNLF